MITDNEAPKKYTCDDPSCTACRAIDLAQDPEHRELLMYAAARTAIFAGKAMVELAA